MKCVFAVFLHRCIYSLYGLPQSLYGYSEISLAPSRGRILYAIYGNSTCVINHIVITAIDKRYRNYYVSTGSEVGGVVNAGVVSSLRPVLICMTCWRSKGTNGG